MRLGKELVQTNGGHAVVHGFARMIGVLAELGEGNRWQLTVDS